LSISQKNSIFYDNDIKKGKKDRATFSATLRTRSRIISNLIKKYKMRGRLLDAGCGTGDLLDFIIKNNKFESIEGADFSKEACLCTQNKLGIKTFIVDLRNISKLKNKSYDVIICSEVLEHIEEDEKVIKNLATLLKRKGKLIITVPFLKKNWSRFDIISGHVRRYEKGELEKKLKKVGFKILDSFAWGNFIYSFYFNIFIKNKNYPSSRKSFFSIKVLKFISLILSYIFLIDNFFINKRDGKTLFIVAEKNDEK